MNYLFRGKRIDNGGWVEGCLTRYSEHMSYITVNLVEGEVYKVHTNSIGMWTGLTDKNGQKIFGALPDSKGGDIVSAWDPMFGISESVIWKVLLGPGGFGFLNSHKIARSSLRDIEIIGNAFDNPELLEDA